MALAGVLLLWAFEGSGAATLDRILPLLRQANKFEIVLAIATLLFANYVRGLRWIVFAGRPVSRLTSFAAVCASYVVNNLLPRGGEVVRVGYLSRSTRIPVATVAATIGVERLLDVVTLGILIFVALLVMPDVSLEDWGRWLAFGKAVSLIGATLLIGLFLIARSKSARMRIMEAGVTPGAGRRGRLFRILHSFVEGLAFMRSTRSWASTLAWTVLLWGLYMAVFVLGLDAFHFLDPLGLRGAYVVFCVTSLSSLIPTPASAGGYHLLGMTFLVHAYGMDPKDALAFVTAFHGIEYFGANGLLSGLVWMVDLSVSRRPKSGVDRGKAAAME